MGQRKESEKGGRRKRQESAAGKVRTGTGTETGETVGAETQERKENRKEWRQARDRKGVEEQRSAQALTGPEPRLPKCKASVRTTGLSFPSLAEHVQPLITFPSGAPITDL